MDELPYRKWVLKLYLLAYRNYWWKRNLDYTINQSRDGQTFWYQLQIQRVYTVSIPTRMNSNIIEGLRNRNKEEMSTKKLLSMIVRNENCSRGEHVKCILHNALRCVWVIRASCEYGETQAKRFRTALPWNNLEVQGNIVYWYME